MGIIMKISDKNQHLTCRTQRHTPHKAKLFESNEKPAKSTDDIKLSINWNALRKLPYAGSDK